MEDLRKKLEIVLTAIFGDQSDPKGKPGIVSEITKLDNQIHITNLTLQELRVDIKRGVWVVLGGVITSVLAIVLKR